MLKACWLALVVVGCSTKPAAPDAQGAPPHPEPTVAPSAKELPTKATGESCGDVVCNPPEQCITVVGMTPNSARKECWITCADKACPPGLECTMIHDGPGQVCVKPKE